MLKLKNVTLVAFDSIHPEKTLRAMRFSMRQVEFASAVLVGDEKNEWLANKCHAWGIELKSGITTDRADHEYAVMESLPSHFSTSHCLFVEWDAAVANSAAWDQKFLDYDFIGAPWVRGAQEDTFWKSSTRKVNPKETSPIANESNCVGNGGFSLRSKRFCAEVARHIDRSNPHQLCSDAWMCRTLRPVLDKKKIKFAPEALAERFSCEDRIYSGQFGFHGDNTIRLNNLNWNLDWL